jgi:ubiquinone/menaquinone biosynthesis C-methylase UbiE
MKSSIIFLNLRRKLLCYVFSFLEFFTVKNTLVHRFYTKWIGKIFRDEYTMANVSSDETVLHIGCGSLPTMSILVAKNAHAKVIAIDNDIRMVQRAQRYINQQKLNDFITVTHGDGKSYPAETFDVIFIAINVTSIDAVFQHLASTSKPSVRIVCRDLGNGVIRMLKSDEFSYIFTIRSIMKHSINNSLLITKHKYPT